MSSSVLHGFAAHRFRATSARFSRMRTTSAMRCLCMALRSSSLQLGGNKMSPTRLESSFAHRAAPAAESRVLTLAGSLGAEALELDPVRAEGVGGISPAGESPSRRER